MVDFEARFDIEPFLTMSTMEWAHTILTLAKHAKEHHRRFKMAPGWLARAALRIQEEERHLEWQKTLIAQKRARERLLQESRFTK